LAARWAALMPGQRSASLVAGWRGLGLFWIVLILLLAIGGATLQILGPLEPRPPARQVAIRAPVAVPAPQPILPQSRPAAETPALPRPGRDTPGPIADPDPALLEPLGNSSSELLPRIATDGRMAMQVYAAGFDTTTKRPMVGLLIAGLGLNQAESDTAIRTLPGGITFAISPYAPNPAKLLAAARLAEHEYLLSIPMEPQGFPLNDPGPQALMTNLAPEQNATRLRWTLSRFAGYVGATGALGGMRGERLASLPDQINPVLTELAHRGLLYVDPRPEALLPPLAWSRSVDIVVDEPATAIAIDHKLGQLTRLARDKGSALGLVTVVRPMTTARVASWANGLAADGLALAPVSALVRPLKAGPAP
jgi:polysaccharide deacetylase 2 family uncharacterized protein YibQ